MKKFLLLGIVALLLAGATESFAQNRHRGQRYDRYDRYDSQRSRRDYRSDRNRRNYNDFRNDRRRGNGYYRRGAGSPRHPVFGHRNRYRHRNRHRNYNY